MVEDNETFAAVVIEQFLRDHHVTLVTTVADALQHATDGFTCALIDYDLPDGKGDAVVSDLRRRVPAALIIGISSHGPGNAALAAAGADAVCPKRQFDDITRVMRAARDARA